MLPKGTSDLGFCGTGVFWDADKSVVEDSPHQEELVTLMAAGDLTVKRMFRHQNDATVLGGTLCQLHMDPLRYILCLCNIFMYLHQHAAIKPNDTPNIQLF